MSKELIERLREYADNNGYSHGDYADSMEQAAHEIESLEAERDALAAELKALREQEPVAWYCEIEDWGREYNGMPGMSNGAIGTPLYARPVTARRLTDEIISHLYDQAGFYPNETREAADHFARAIESALFGGELQSPKGDD